LGDRRGGLAALAIAALLWSTTFVVGKWALEMLPPLSLALARFLVASLVLLPIGLRETGPLPGRAPLMMLGLLGVTGFYAFFNFGLALTSASEAALIQGAGPALTAMVATLVLGERLRLSGWAGLGLSGLGVGLIVLSGSDKTDAPAPLLGDLLLVGSLLCWAIYTIQFKRLAHYPRMRLTAVSTALGTVLLVPLAAAEMLLGQGIGPSSEATWLAVVYLGLGPSAASYLLWNHALREVPATQAGSFLNLIPVCGVVLAALLLGEQPTGPDLLGGGLVVFGVWLTTRNGSESPVPSPDRTSRPGTRRT
jgi:drug/metabolite transporter (DMT)-like permease